MNHPLELPHPNKAFYCKGLYLQNSKNNEPNKISKQRTKTQTFKKI